MTVAIHASDLGAAKYLDVRCVHDPMGEITGHAFAKIVPADEKEPLAPVIEYTNCRLPRGLAAANEHLIRSPTHFNFVRRGRIINPAALELTAAFDLEASIFRAGGDEQTFCHDSLPALQRKNGIRLLECH